MIIGMAPWYNKRYKRAIVSITERRSRFALIYKIEQKKSCQATKAISKLFPPIKNNVHTLTFNNGNEFASHEVLSNKLEAEFYFDNHYSSFERGLNENTDSLIRQYFPKDRDFTTKTDEEIIRAFRKINNRPRKCLGLNTSNHILKAVFVALNI